MNLPPQAFARHDTPPDSNFYAQARLVTHIDDAAIAAVTEIYREMLPEGGAILDLMSSWVSHLPPEMEFSRVAGLGMNARELQANPRLSEHVVQSLNDEPILPYGDAEFDAVVCCVSVQYLTRPIEVWHEVARVCKPGAPAIITFSNRCFPTKAIYGWQALDDQGHGTLVGTYLQEAGGWHDIEFLDRSPNPRRSDPLFAVAALRQ